MTWNAITTYWIGYATVIGAVLAILATSIYMSLSFIFLHISKRYFKRSGAYILFIVFWLAQEYLHNLWELAWPWLNLGNVFATVPEIVQWYSITGRTGGSLWVLLVNLFFFAMVEKRRWFPGIAVILLIFLPVVTSFYLSRDVKKGDKGGIMAMAVQPDIDPYTEKFNGIPAIEQLKTMFKFCELYDACLYVLPETAYPEPVPLERITETGFFELIKSFLSRKKDAVVVTGFSPYVLYHTKETPTAKQIKSNPSIYVDYFNSAMLAEWGNIDVYHKNKLVIGVERIPYPFIFGFLEPLALNLGGTAGSLATQGKPSVLNSLYYGIKIAAPICYESVFGDYVSEMIRQGATIITVITNDGWWDTSPGHYQHFQYARLLAVETRRWIVRSANTGISAIISPSGDVTAKLSYGKHGIVIGDVFLRDDITPFVKYGDFIGRISMVVALLGVLMTFARFIYKKIA